jgi:hypothetical protein
MTTTASFSTLPLSGSTFALGTTSGMTDSGLNPVTGTTTARLSTLEIYFRVGTPDALTLVLETPPSVGEVVYHVLKEPGMKAHELAVELLGRLSARTLQFALQTLPSNENIWRKVYSNKVWEIVISALGLADDKYAQFIDGYMRGLLDDPNPVKRLAAFDALETLRD